MIRKLCKQKEHMNSRNEIKTFKASIIGNFQKIAMFFKQMNIN